MDAQESNENSARIDQQHRDAAEELLAWTNDTTAAVVEALRSGSDRVALTDVEGGGSPVESSQHSRDAHGEAANLGHLVPHPLPIERVRATVLTLGLCFSNPSSVRVHFVESDGVLRFVGAESERSGCGPSPSFLVGSGGHGVGRALDATARRSTNRREAQAAWSRVVGTADLMFVKSLSMHPLSRRADQVRNSWPWQDGSLGTLESVRLVGYQALVEFGGTVPGWVQLFGARPEGPAHVVARLRWLGLQT